MKEKTFEEIVMESTSYSMVLRKLGLAISGASIRKLKKQLAGLDVSHFTMTNPSHSLDKRISKESFLSSLKKDSVLHGPRTLSRLKEFGIKEHQCERCNNATWNGLPIPLQIDHIDGDHYNNELENLKVLCPNCHSQTKTWGGKKLKKPDNFCECGRKIGRKSKKCVRCSITGKNRKTKINWPTKDELLKKLELSSFSALARELGVSDNAIRKHLKKF